MTPIEGEGPQLSSVPEPQDCLGSLNVACKGGVGRAGERGIEGIGAPHFKSGTVLAPFVAFLRIGTGDQL